MELWNKDWINMENYKVLSTEKRFCPVCGKVHNVEKRSRIVTGLVKAVKVDYEEIYFYCDNFGSKDDYQEFVPAGLMDENLDRAREAYNKLKQI